MSVDAFTRYNTSALVLFSSSLTSYRESSVVILLIVTAICIILVLYYFACRKVNYQSDIVTDGEEAHQILESNDYSWHEPNR